MTEKIIVGSRRSPLAVAQTSLVVEQLRREHPELSFEIRKMSTEGDEDYRKELGTPTQGKDAFTRRIEQKLLLSEIDLAVHSLKDLPTKLPSELTIGAIPEREDARDALVAVERVTLRDFPAGGRIGTSSQRRKLQLLAARPDIRITDLRGNIGTRIRKMEENGLGGIVLASAALKRLGLGEKIAEIFSPDLMLPAIGQGALAVEIRRNDSHIAKIVQSVEHVDSRLATEAERAFAERLGGGCNLPVAAYAATRNEILALEGMVGSMEKVRMIRDRISGAKADARRIGLKLAERMLARGAREMIVRETA